MKTSVQLLLHSKLLELRKKNPQYSSRAFAKKIGVSSGALSEILNGTRFVSPKLAERFSHRLTLDPMEKASLLKRVLSSSARKRNADLDSDVNYLRVSSDQFKMMSEWYYFAILSLMKTTDFKNTPEYIAKRLGISKAVAQQAIERMLRLGVISVEKDGSLIRKPEGYRTSDDIKDLSIQKSHFETLEMAKTALEQVSVELRDYTSLTMPLAPEKLSDAKQMIRSFQNDFYKKFSEGEPAQEVYRLSLQLFPLTQPLKTSKLKKEKI